MNSKVFDVAIIGGGVSGASIAHSLSRYNIEVVLLEKEIDVCFGVSKANSGIIHAGFHHSTDSLKSGLEIKGNLMFEKLQHELSFPFKRCGILVVAFSYEEMKTVEHLYAQGVANGVPNIEIYSGEKTRAIEPQLNTDVVGALYAPTGGVIEPYRYVFALIESAKKNGLFLKTQFEVKDATLKNGIYTIEDSNGDNVKAKYIVNAAGLYADKISTIFNAEKFEIIPRKGEEYLLDRNSKGHPKHVLFPVPVKNSKGMLVIPTVEGTTMLGPTAEIIDDKEDKTTSTEKMNIIFSQAKHITPNISTRDIITAFAGLRPTLKGNDFYIAKSELAPNFIQVAGIQSPGLTASPAIGEYVKDILKKNGLSLNEKTDYSPTIPKFKTVRNKSTDELNDLVTKHPEYGNIICRCEKISEGEIIEAIHKGHTTLDGIKFYTRAGMGRCQGGFCSYKILKIISRETGIPITEISKRGAGSYIVKEKLGEEN
jgi:glycerol-3-phosphate dehydrogenase